MFNKRNRKFKSRRKDDIIDLSEEREEDIIEIDVEPAYQLINRSKPAKSNTTSILSFDNEEDEVETFKIKRPNHSKRIAKQLKRDRAEELFVKRKNEKEVKGRSPQQDAYRNPQELKLKQPVSTKDKGNYDKQFKQYSDDEPLQTEQQHEPVAVNPFSGIIPDAITINEIRRKRQQMARGVGANKDTYIKLDKSKDNAGSTSRLVREEDHDRSDEDEDILGTTTTGRDIGNGKQIAGVSFTANSREYVLRDIQRKIIAAEEDDADSDHEDTWEHQQIKKATGKKMTASKSKNRYNLGDSPYNNDEDNSNMKNAFKSSSEKLTDMTISDIICKLTTRYNEMKEAHIETVNTKNDITSRLQQLSLNKTNDDGTVKQNLDKKYRFFQETRSYFTDLIACLNAKLPAILCIERGYISIESVRATRVLNRSRLDLKEESSMYSSKPPELDQEEAEKRQQRCAEREGRRSRRRRYRVDKGQQDHDEGMSTDDEVSKSQQVKFQTERERLNMEKGRVFEDVIEEFSRPKRVIIHFTKWRDDHSTSYSDAYISLCLPKMMVPFARFECLDWNPLKDNLSDITSHTWYQGLLYYHRNTTANSEMPPGQDDYNVIPAIMDKVIVPKITSYIEKVWSPSSTKQTTNLVSVISSLRQDYPNINIKNKNTQLMMKALVTRLKATIDEDIYIPLMDKQKLENKKLATSSYFYRQFWSSVKIYSNILLMKDVLSRAVLKKLAIESLLCRYLVMALASISQCNPPAVVVAYCEMLISLIPVAWFKDETLALDASLKQLHFILEQLAASAYSRIIAANDESHKSVRELIRRILSILKIIKAHESFKKVCEKYSIRL